MSRISISLAVLSLAGAGIFAGCGLLTDDDAPINFYESGVITFSRYEYPHHSLIGLDLASREETVLADTLGWECAIWQARQRRRNARGSPTSSAADP